MAKVRTGAVLLLLSLCVPYSASQKEEIRTTTDKGDVIGHVVKGLEDIEYFAFKGIPYARPPVGLLRFKLPYEPEPWRKPLVLNDEKPLCPQIGGALSRAQVIGREDCLYLNVFVPKVEFAGAEPLKVSLPVMVYIHEGGFLFGTSSDQTLGPDFFMATQKVVLVTFAYRLGALGFLNLQRWDCPGNMGLWDQRAVLQWVQRNIKNFGGDRESVTIFGNSAGAASVHFHMMYRKYETRHAPRLFHKAILQSGNGLAGWAYNKWQMMMSSLLYYEITGQTGEMEEYNFRRKNLYEIFFNATVKELVGATHTMTHKNYLLSAGYPAFIPSKERPDERDQLWTKRFIQEDPEYTTTEGFPMVPTMVGITENEGLFAYQYAGMAKTSRLSDLKNYPELFLPTSLQPADEYQFRFGQRHGLHNYLQTRQAFRYFNRELTSAYAGFETLQNYTTYLGDLFTGISHHRFVKAVRRHTYTYAPLFVYKFTADGKYNYMKRLLRIEGKGASHADELGYLFRVRRPLHLRQSSLDPESADEYYTIRKMTGMWTDFASDVDIERKYDWPKTNRDQLYVKNIGLGATRDKNERTTSTPTIEALDAIFERVRTRAFYDAIPFDREKKVKPVKNLNLTLKEKFHRQFWYGCHKQYFFCLMLWPLPASMKMAFIEYLVPGGDVDGVDYDPDRWTWFDSAEVEEAEEKDEL